MSTTSPNGSARQWGPLWGSRAQDWARVEEQQRPTYEEAIRRAGITTGQRVLDVGCGTGAFLRVAADHGAQVFGLDASEELLAIARTRVPEAELTAGDLQYPPYEDDAFDTVCGFNSFFFAADITAALREAGRVARPGAPVVVQVWGRPERCAIDAMKAVVRPFMPGPPPPPLWEPGVLEGIASDAGLTPESAFDVSWAYQFADAAALGRAMLAPAGVAELVGPEREPEVADAIVRALAPHRTAAGAYRLENEYHFLLARA
jgi:SAM-dependent methyltransferase